MSADAARLADARAWLAKAALDLRAADLELRTPELSLWGDITFHAQQAAEKAPKAFLAWHDQPFRRTHSIEELGRLCTTIAPELTPAVEAAVPLSAYAWKFRYPGDADEPTPQEAERSVQLARSLVAAVERLIPPAAG